MELLCALALAGPNGISRARLIRHFFGGRESPNRGLNELLSRLRASLQRLSRVPLIVGEDDRLKLINVDADSFALRATITKADPSSAEVSMALAALQTRPATDLAPDPYRTVLVESLRREIAESLLASMVSWAESPKFDRCRPKLPTVVERTQRHLHYNGLMVESLVRIYGALDLKELMLQTLEDYETYLEREFGESAPSRLLNLVDTLATQIDERKRGGDAPPSSGPPRLYGRNAELLLLQNAAQVPGILMVTGHSGVGKSALLQTLASLDSFRQRESAWIDLSQMDEERAVLSAISRAPELVFIDHLPADRDGILDRMRRMLPKAAIIVASVSPRAVAATSIALQPLGHLPECDYEPGLSLFLERAARYGAELSESMDDSKQIVRLSGGVPHILDMVARLTATVGIRAGRELLERWEASEDPAGVEQVWPAMTSATRAAAAALPIQDRAFLSLLARLDVPLDARLAVDSRAIPADTIRRLASSGLTESSEGGMIGLQRISRTAVKTIAAELTTEAEIVELSRSLVSAILAEPTANIGATGSARLVAQCLVNLLANADPALGLELLEEVRQTLVAGGPLKLEEWALVRYLESDDLTPGRFGTAALAYGAFLFVACRYEEMLQLAQNSLGDTRAIGMPDSATSNLIAQRGLALRCLGRFEESLASYLSALQTARKSADRRTIARVCYSAAMLYAQSGRDFDEAVALIDEALEMMAEFPNVAAKIEMMNMRAMARYHTGAPLDEVVDEFRATLCHAARFKLLDHVAWLTQNLGGVYASHGRLEESAVCHLGGIILAVDLSEGLSAESSRLIRSAISTLGDSLIRLGFAERGVTCRSLMDRIGLYETFKQGEPMAEALKAETYRKDVAWSEIAVSTSEIRSFCQKSLEELSAARPSSLKFSNGLKALSGNSLFKMTSASTEMDTMP